MAATKSNAVKDGDVSRSSEPFRIRILLRIGEERDVMALPTPRRIREGTNDVYRLPGLYTTADEDESVDTTRGLAGRRISAPYGLMYQRRVIREDNDAGAAEAPSTCRANEGLIMVFVKLIWEARRVGRVPGRFASSDSSGVAVPAPSQAGEAALVMYPGTASRPTEGCEMLFCPVIEVPSARPAHM